MLQFRTISQLVKLFVLPEIKKRIESGLISQSDLPFELSVFRVIQTKQPNGTILPIVELNQEVQIRAKVTVTRPVEKGESLKIKDIVPNECLLDPPIYDGQPAAYFLWQTAFLDHYLFYDCSPNVPEISKEELEDIRISYPIFEFFLKHNFYMVIRPMIQFKVLADNNWPPGPAYYPEVLKYVFANLLKINDDDFVEVVANSYNRDYWNKRITFWEKTDFFPNRIQYIRKAVDAYFQADFISSIYIIVPQFEGVIREYLTNCSCISNEGFRDSVDRLKSLIFSRMILLFPRVVCEVIFEYLRDGSFWRAKSWEVADPSDQVNRHGIVHGVFIGFECKAISLKYLILFDSLALLLLHDKMVAGTLR